MQCFEKFGRFQRSIRNGQLARFHLRLIQQIADQTQELIRVLHDSSRHVDLLVGHGPVDGFLEHFGVSQDCIERCAQFM
jgi:hypothetical protein